jgi:hypothetical protein
MSKMVTTIAFSTPVTVAEDMDILCKELNISRSALITTLVSIGLKWYKEGLNNGVQGRQEGESYIDLRARDLHARGRKESD